MLGLSIYLNTSESSQMKKLVNVQSVKDREHSKKRWLEVIHILMSRLEFIIMKSRGGCGRRVCNSRQKIRRIFHHLCLSHRLPSSTTSLDFFPFITASMALTRSLMLVLFQALGYSLFVSLSLLLSVSDSLLDHNYSITHMTDDCNMLHGYMHELARSPSYISARSGDIIVGILTHTYEEREPRGTDVGPVYVKEEKARRKETREMRNVIKWGPLTFLLQQFEAILSLIEGQKKGSDHYSK